MRRKKTKFLPVVLAMLLMVSNISTNLTAFAAVEDGRSGSVLMLESEAPEPDEESASTGMNEIAELNDADEIGAGGSAGTVRTLSDVTIKLSDNELLNEVWKITGAVELDLNGYKVTEAETPTGSFVFSDDTTIGTALIYVADGGSLTVEDSAGGGSIETKSQIYTIAAEGGTVTIESGTISDDTASGHTIWIREDSELEVNGGTITASGNSGRAINVNASTIEINGGIINCTSTSGYAVYAGSGSSVTLNEGSIFSNRYGICSNGSTVEINGGYIYADAEGSVVTHALEIAAGSKLTMNGGTVETGDYGISLGISGSDSYETTTVIINDGTITSQLNAISGNYTDTNIDVTINGGLITTTGGKGGAEGAIYMPNDGTLTINDGQIIGDTNGICIRTGNLKITGGYIEAKGNEAEYSTSNYETGYGIMVYQHQKTVSGNEYDRNINVDISGGEIIGTDYAFYEEPRTANGDDWEQHISLSISGGIFKSTGHTREDGTTDTHPVEIIGEDNSTNTSEITITGGFFSDHVEESDYIANGYMCIEGVSTTGDSGTEYTDCHAVIPDVITVDNTTFDIDRDEFIYNGQSQVPVVSNVVIKDDKTDESVQNAVTLVADKHYTVSYALDDTEIPEEDVVKVNDYEIIVTGTGEDADCSFDKTGEEHTKQDSLNGSVSKPFSIVYGDIDYGDLTVKKVVENKPSDSDIAYDFNLVLVESDSDALDLNEVEISYSIKDSDNKEVKSGEFTFGSTVESSNNAVESSSNAKRSSSKLFSFQLKDGQYITFEGIPEDMEYTVTETSESDGYTTTAENESGTISSEPAVVTFTNTYESEEEPEPAPEPIPEPEPHHEPDEYTLTLEIVDRNGKNATGAVFEVYDSEGVLVGTYTQGSSDIVISDLPKGTYTITITNKNGYVFGSSEYSIKVSSDMTYTIQATNAKSTSSSSGNSGGGGSSSSSRSSSSSIAAEKSGKWILEGALFTYPDGSHPSNCYLNIGGEIWAFYTNGYAVNKRHEAYYTAEAIAAAGNIPTATGTWEVCGWWYEYDDGTYPHNEWAQLTYNGQTYWYHFDVDGWMDDGWFTENGITYYLDSVYDGWRGHMVTGWQEIGGAWYYFSEDPNSLGVMLKDTTTPDGFKVDANGRWVE